MPGLLPSSPVSICPTACESPPYRWCSGPLGCIHNNLDRRLSSNDPTNFTSFSSIIPNSPASLCVHYTNSCIPSPPNFLSVDFETAVSADRVILWAGEVFSSMIQPVCTAGSQGIQREGRIWSWGVRWVACPKSQASEPQEFTHLTSSYSTGKAPFPLWGGTGWRGRLTVKPDFKRQPVPFKCWRVGGGKKRFLQ